MVKRNAARSGGGLKPVAYCVRVAAATHAYSCRVHPTRSKNVAYVNIITARFLGELVLRAVRGRVARAAYRLHAGYCYYRPLLHGDPTRVGQIVREFASNVKFVLNSPTISWFQSTCSSSMTDSSQSWSPSTSCLPEMDSTKMKVKRLHSPHAVYIITGLYTSINQ